LCDVLLEEANRLARRGPHSVLWKLGGASPKRSALHRRPSEVEKSLAEILVSGQEAPNPEGVLQTIEQIVAQTAPPK